MGETILILANGTWGATQRVERLAAACSWILATDGAWTKARATGLRVDEVIGDLDSLSAVARETLASADVSVLQYPVEKDKTDLELALDRAAERGASRVLLFGALGGRLDHALAAVQLLEAATTRDIHVSLISEWEDAWMARDAEAIPDACVGDRVSILPLTSSAVVRTCGLKYPLHGERLFRGSSRGVSNQVARLPIRIETLEGRVLIVHGRERI